LKLMVFGSRKKGNNWHDKKKDAIDGLQKGLPIFHSSMLSDSTFQRAEASNGIYQLLYMDCLDSPTDIHMDSDTDTQANRKQVVKEKKIVKE